VRVRDPTYAVVNDACGFSRRHLYHPDIEITQESDSLLAGHLLGLVLSYHRFSCGDHAAT